MLYLYLFDYTEAFLPFIHTICPMQEDKYEDAITKLLVSIKTLNTLLALVMSFQPLPLMELILGF